MSVQLSNLLYYIHMQKKKIITLLDFHLIVGMSDQDAMKH